MHAWLTSKSCIECLCDTRCVCHVSAVLLQRIVRMGGPVDDDMANLIVAQLLYLDSADQQKDITMYVNSPGGSVTAGGLDWLVAGCVGWLVFGWLAGRHTNCV